MHCYKSDVVNGYVASCYVGGWVFAGHGATHYSAIHACLNKLDKFLNGHE